MARRSPHATAVGSNVHARDGGGGVQRGQGNGKGSRDRMGLQV
jgi:hypothetical protein